MSARSPSPKDALSIGCTAHVVQDGMTATVYVLMPLLAQAFGFTYAQVGLVKGLKSVAQGTLELFSGVVSERYGEGRALVFGLVLSGLGYCLLAGAPSAIVVIACLLIIGAGTAFQHAPSSALIVNCYPVEGRRGPLGLYNSSGDVGKLLFTGCFSLAIGAGIAWERVSLAYGGVAIFTALAILVMVRRLQGVQHQLAPTGTMQEPEAGRSGWGILNWQSYSTLLVVVSLDTMVQAGVLVFVAFLMLSKGLPLVLATAATVVLLIGGVFGKAACGFLAERVGVRPAFALIQLFTAIGLVLVVVVSDWIAFALLLPLGAVLQGSTSVTYGFAADLIHPRRMARGYALLYASGSLFSAAGPYAFGLVADGLGIETAVFTMAAVAILAVPPIAFLSAGTESRFTQI